MSLDFSTGLLNCLKCPLTRQPMRMPVLAGDGWTYEFEALLEYVEGKQALSERITSPKTSNPMRYVKLKPNMVVRRLTELCTEWRRTRCAHVTLEQMLRTLTQELSCPITHNLINVPVLAADGCTYEADDVCAWLQYCEEREHPPTSPISQLRLLDLVLIPNYIVTSCTELLQAATGRSGGAASFVQQAESVRPALADTEGTSEDV